VQDPAVKDVAAQHTREVEAVEGVEAVAEAPQRGMADFGRSAEAEADPLERDALALEALLGRKLEGRLGRLGLLGLGRLIEEKILHRGIEPNSDTGGLISLF